MTGVHAPSPLDDPSIRALFARELDFGFAGEDSIWNMTRTEQRVYLEGLRQLNEAEADAANGGERPKGQPRDSDMAMMRELENDLSESQTPAG